jgi:hypothetical protein
MQHEAEGGDPRQEEVEVLRDEAEVLEAEAVGLVATAIVLDAEADRLEREREEIHFTVDGESYETRHRERTPDGILVIAELNPALRYLEEVSPEKASFKDRGEEQIRMVDRMVFITLSIGPTPTS